MPIYEYQCRKCGDEFDAIQGFSDKPLKKCKKCGGSLHKLISECSFHLKGTGWYVTDYAKPGANGRKDIHETKSETASDGDSKKTKDNKSTAKPKPATKTTSAPATTSAAAGPHL